MKTSATHLYEAWQWMGVAVVFWLVAVGAIKGAYEYD